MDDYGDLDSAIASMTAAQRKKRIKQLKKGTEFMKIPEAVEWICLTQRVTGKTAETMLREKLATGELPSWWAD